MAKDTIQGQVVGTTGRVGLNALRVEAWDRDQRTRERLGTATTDATGAFAILVDERFRRDLAERKPDVYFKVFRGEQLLADTGAQVVWNIRNPDVQVVIPLRDPTTGDDGQGTPRLPTVEGLVTTGSGRPVTAVTVELWSQRLRGDALLASAATDAKGHYSVQYDRGTLGKAALDLYVRVLDPRRRAAELARSPVVYDAEAVVVIDVTVTRPVARPTEYERLLAAVQPA